ncbi:carbonate dehydratase [Rhodovibrio salinarum]|uniref:Carbonic anhydrase n=1 Tax=Rhodovibrio salinarum TaxID=1087 RepID=A0A934QIZ1_9PROT|nr:carbonate dehydratase [Rhodovibrio salinarum]MBK1697415.1 carbonate dehydratase [Rhodovibrio salinarum]
MSLKDLLDNNARWAAQIDAEDPQYFRMLSQQQSPEYLWIGCSDSRVPANQIVDLHPGELFVHRNVANLVVASDLNMLAVLQFAVETLRVRHVIVTGHYGCGGVRAALRRVELGLIDNWLEPLRRLGAQHAEELASLGDEAAQTDRLCEINVVQQATNVAQTPIIQGAWRRGQKVSVHGWIYGLADGRLRDLGCTLRGPDDLDPATRLRVE